MCESFMLSLCFLFEYMYFLFFNKGSSLGLVSFKMISKEIFFLFVCFCPPNISMKSIFLLFSVFFVSLGVIQLFFFQRSSLFLIYSLILVISFKLYVRSSIYLFCSVSWGLLDWHQVRKDMELFLKEKV